jgi:mono/diheme cytochrome c family protein
MSEKPALFKPISEREMYEVTAYLIAITPDLQRSSKQKKQQQLARDTAVADAVASLDEQDATTAPPATAPQITAPPSTAPPTTAPPSTTPPSTGTTTPQPPAGKPRVAVDLARAKATYEEVCSQCHELSEVTKAPPKTARESRQMIQRMIKENEAEMTPAQIELVTAWLDAEFVVKRGR